MDVIGDIFGITEKANQVVGAATPTTIPTKQTKISVFTGEVKKAAAKVSKKKAKRTPAKRKTTKKKARAKRKRK